eukprot:15324792-Ditylum_brightwellii.AAC.1
MGPQDVPAAQRKQNRSSNGNNEIAKLQKLATQLPKRQCTTKRIMSNKTTLPSYKRLYKPTEIHEHGRLRRFHGEYTGHWKDEVKCNNFGCMDYEVPCCKKHSIIYHRFGTST